ncbi:skeletal aspartic acid-rich protein 2-like isoform X2 [Rhopilema esculentum]|uniref:skeletal aspartic acid-rich protein 2-like isoform X2 n=1 Tax=Rhopilema esculentum TaxID=499914 RepID=UPI0031DAA2E4
MHSLKCKLPFNCGWFDVFSPHTEQPKPSKGVSGMMLRTIVAIAAIFVLCCDADKNLEDGDLKVNIRGQSGKITFSRKGNSLTVNFDYIKELDKDGNEVGTSGSKKHSINSFAKESFTFKTAGLKTEYQNISVKHTQFEATISGPGAKLIVDIFIFKGSGNIKTSKNETLEVKKGTAKFNIKLESWTFCGGSGGDSCSKGGAQEIGNQIELGIEIKGKKKPLKKGKGKGKGRKVETFDLGDGDCTLSGAVEVDGTWKEMVASYPKVETKGAKTLFMFRFPKFSSKVIYDPTVELSAAGGSSALKVGILTVLASILALMKILS